MRLPAITLALLFAFFALGSGSGCIKSKPYECANAEQCIKGDSVGRCEAAGFCSFISNDCSSGWRFEAEAGDDLGGVCVEAPSTDPDAGVEACGASGAACCDDGTCQEGGNCNTTSSLCEPCGGVDQACCTGDVCGQNKFCQSGVCTQCVTDFASGRRHSCMLRYDGTVWCTGDAEFGQRGDGVIATDMPILTPVQVSALSEVSPIDDATAISSGREHTCAVRAEGTVWCWGRNNQGQLGDGNLVTSADAVQVLLDPGTEPLKNITVPGAGDRHSCALDGTGGVWCWGTNSQGSLGDGTIGRREMAAPVTTIQDGPSLAGAIELMDSDHMCIRKADDTMWCWGKNNNGQLGNGTNVHGQFPEQTFVAKSGDTGRRHTCAVKADGTVWCWGENWRGRIGNAATNQDSVLSPAQVVSSEAGQAFTGVAEIILGAVSCALMETSEAMCWGNNNYGQTGTGPGSHTPLPVLMPDGSPLTGIERMTAGFSRVCAFLDDGSLYCWGRNTEGQLGDGTRLNRGLPTAVSLTCP